MIKSLTAIVLKTVRSGSLVCLLFVAGAMPGLATDPSEQVDVLAYRFAIAVNDTTDVISGSAEIDFRARRNIRDFELDLVNSTGERKGMKVREVTRNGSPLKFTHENDRLKIFLGSEVSAGGRGTVSVSYEGIPRDGLIISKNKFGDRTFFADNWPDRGRNWLPVIDHPADKATVEFAVIAPVHYEVIANGIRKEESFLSEKQKLTRYIQKIPISTKVMVIGVARFAVQRAGVVEQIPVESWVYPQNRDEGFRDYAVAVDVLDYFNRQIGPYPYGKLANVQSKTTFGGLENASAIFYSENSVTGQAAAEGLIAHEIAHQWFGNSATEKDWQHLWLSEGFATYFSLLYKEHRHGAGPRDAELKKDREQVISWFARGPGPVVNTAETDPMKLLNANSYQKGSWVLHMLRNRVGDSVFWQGIRNYYAAFRDSIATTSDFRRVMENASGQNLERFFHQWVHTAGHPALEGEWKYNGGTKTVEITLRQAQDGDLFDFPLEIAIFGENRDKFEVHRVNINKEAHSFSIPSAARPSRVELDPYVNLLFEGGLSN